MNFYRPPYQARSESYHHLCECPRCGHLSYEYMSSYAHCVNCLYFCDYQETFLPVYYSMESFEEKFRFLSRGGGSGPEP